MEVREKKERESSIELLRIIIVMGVILLHYNNPTIGGGFKYVEEGGINHYYLFLIQNIFVCAVNVFVIMSGYFLCIIQKRSFVKVADLIIQVIFFNGVYYLVAIFFNNTQITFDGIINCFIPKNYYVILYSTLYLISQYINIVIKQLSKIQLRKFVAIMFCLFSCYTIFVDYASAITGLKLEGLSTVGLNGSSAGYTIVNFILLYIVGAYIRLNDSLISKKKLGLILPFLILAMQMITIVEFKNGIGPNIVWNYNNPIIIIVAACILLFFKQIKIQSKVINELAKGVFTCFLFHTTILPFFKIEQMVNSSLLFLVVNQVIMVLVIYLVSYIMYRVYIILSEPFVKMIAPLCLKIDKILFEN